MRITAQLIKADDGTHLWTESYDRELTDIFAIQEDIAAAIAGALRVPLGLAPGERLVSNRTIDPESYQQFLRARAILRNRGGPGSSVDGEIGTPARLQCWNKLSLAIPAMRRPGRCWRRMSVGPRQEGNGRTRGHSTGFPQCRRLCRAGADPEF